MPCDVTYEELAALAVGELPDDREGQVLEHLSVCDRCRRRLEAVRRADATLETLSPCPPPGEALLAARKALSRVVREPAAADVMTLDEVAAFLRVGLDELEDIIEALPAFEFAGRIRVRRDRLIEWIRQRERDYTRQTAGSWAAREATGGPEQGAF